MKYSIKAFLVYAIVMLITLLVVKMTDVVLLPLHISSVGLFMCATSMLVHHFTVQASAKNPKRFPAYFMAITGLKMMVYIIAIGSYVFVFQHSATPVIVTFLFLYVVYTVLEVHSALGALKKV